MGRRINQKSKSFSENSKEYLELFMKGLLYLNAVYVSFYFVITGYLPSAEPLPINNSISCRIIVSIIGIVFLGILFNEIREAFS